MHARLKLKWNIEGWEKKQPRSELQRMKKSTQQNSPHLLLTSMNDRLRGRSRRRGRVLRPDRRDHRPRARPAGRRRRSRGRRKRHPRLGAGRPIPEDGGQVDHGLQVRGLEVGVVHVAGRAGG